MDPLVHRIKNHEKKRSKTNIKLRLGKSSGLGPDLNLKNFMYGGVREDEVRFETPE